MRNVRRDLFVLCAAWVVATLAGAPQASNTDEVELQARIEHPRDGAVLDSPDPTLRICVAGYTGKAKPADLRATLDGADIAEEIRWSGECGEWRASDAHWQKAVPHPKRPAPVEFESWEWRLSEGPHTLEIAGAGTAGGESRASARFEIRTRRRFVGFDLGFPDVSLNGFRQPFAPLGSMNLRLGHVRWWSDPRRDDLISYRAHYLGGGAASSELAGSGKAGEAEATFWKGTAGRRRALGYRMGSGGFAALYHGTSAFFGELSVGGTVSDPTDAAALEPFDGRTRVGTSFEGGVHFQFGPSFGIDVGYEQTAVYPHFLFWKALGSGAIHGLALSGTDKLASAIADVSPRTAPIFAFLIKNAISYALYHQREGEVNWPFSSGDALFFEGFKLNAAFSF